MVPAGVISPLESAIHLVRGRRVRFTKRHLRLLLGRFKEGAFEEGMGRLVVSRSAVVRLLRGLPVQRFKASGHQRGPSLLRILRLILRWDGGQASRGTGAQVHRYERLRNGKFASSHQRGHRYVVPKRGAICSFYLSQPRPIVTPMILRGLW